MNGFGARTSSGSRTPGEGGDREARSDDSPEELRRHFESTSLGLPVGVAAIGVAPYPYQAFGRAENAVLSLVGGLVVATTGVRALDSSAPEGGQHMAAYQLDLSRLSLDWLRRVLQTTRLLPSEAILAEQTEQRLAAVRDRGFGNLADLVSALATPRKVDALARELDVPAHFLTVLRRRIDAYQRKPVRLVDLTAVPVAVAHALAGVGLDDSRQLFDRLRGAGPGSRAGLLALCADAGVDVEVLARILSVCDLLRGPYVGPAFAEPLWQAGFRELGDLCALAPDELYDRLVSANAAARCYKQPVPGGEDMRSWLVMVHEVVRGTA